MKIYGQEMSKLKQEEFDAQNLGECCFDPPFSIDKEYESLGHPRVLFNNLVPVDGKIKGENILSFEGVGRANKIFFDSSKINVGIVTGGGLCPGLNDVIRSITYNCLENFKVKTVYGFKFGFQGLTTEHSQEAIRLTPEIIDTIHEQGGTILGSSRGNQDICDIVDTLVKFNVSILFVIGGDGTQYGSMAIVEEITRRKLQISIVGVPKTIDNDISFTHKTFGFDTAVEEARKAIDAAHVEAKGARNGIGMVKLMGRHSGFIAAHATLASGNVNICMIPEAPLVLENFFKKVKKRLDKKDHLVIVVAEGAGQHLISSDDGKEEFDASGNVRLKDIGLYMKVALSDFLNREGIEHTIKYIDPSYMIRSTPANAVDSSFCLNLGNYAVHAGMTGRTNVLVGYWNQHFCLVPIKLALSHRKTVAVNSSLWRAILEITEKLHVT